MPIWLRGGKPRLKTLLLVLCEGDSGRDWPFDQQRVSRLLGQCGSIVQGNSIVQHHPGQHRYPSKAAAASSTAALSSAAASERQKGSEAERFSLSSWARLSISSDHWTLDLPVLGPSELSEPLTSQPQISFSGLKPSVLSWEFQWLPWFSVLPMQAGFPGFPPCEQWLRTAWPF